MECRETELVLEQEDLTALPPAVRQHLTGCNSCRNLVADLTAIVHIAREVPAEVDPPPRLWTSIRAQLEAEGILRDHSVEATPSWWRAASDLFRSRALATASVGFLILAAAALQIRQPESHAVANVQSPLGETGMILQADEQGLDNMHLAGDSAVDTSLRNNLQIVDGFIGDCERRLKEDPRDDLTREYLSGAYRQKAELLETMMERGRSVN
jgi:hypothetical protein